MNKKVSEQIAERTELYASIQAGNTAKVTTAEYRWMLLQFDDFFLYAGKMWELHGVKKDCGVWVVSRKEWTLP